MHGAGASRKAIFAMGAFGALQAFGAQANAGGLAVREQSTEFQGMSFAGAAAGGSLASSFWNSAAIAQAGTGLSSVSSFSVILPDIGIRTQSVTREPGFGTGLGVSNTGFPSNAGADKVDIGRDAFVSSSYSAYRLDKDLVVGVAINSPFGASVEASDRNWDGQYHLRTAKLLTMNVNPMVSYQVAPGLAVGVGAQIEYLRLGFKVNPLTLNATPNQGNSTIEGDNFGFGFTAGLMWSPTASTTLGLGFRSSISHNVKGDQFVTGGGLQNPIAGTQPVTSFGIEGKIDTPEIVTLSARHELNTAFRLLGTIEWTNWSRLDRVDFRATSSGGLPAGLLGGALVSQPGQVVSSFDFHWNDGWLFALGGEWDYTSKITLRAGGAYEISPIQNADQRKVQITDSNRVWASVGASYKYSDTLSFDFGYSHVFFADASIDALTAAPGNAARNVLRFQGEADQSANIISLGMKAKW